MALSDITVPTEVISVGTNNFTVRGLCFDDVTRIIQKHQVAVEKVIDAYGNKVPDAAILQMLIGELPDLTAQVIACAADEPDNIAIARKLPMPKQVEALVAIAKMTFDEVGGVKKFADQLADLFGGLRSSLPASTPV
jgi:hypothetical protein